ncbi:hypothetical protein O4H49_10640 [Kiloniella laminariae]|uniref:Uncharacterized protein n=1 Tax=Kiloniella laminariae TaxID=454162 RepID=A0ABT4LLK6_9PROT|nr:hypothetical protein [Kiloniella laminariae]MCZ4281236.1 hypothetical protein [Kiloniella laminariae]
MINLEKAAEIILSQAAKKAGFSELSDRDKLNFIAEDRNRVIETLVRKWLGCIALIEELKSHPDVIAAKIPDLPEDYVLEKLKGPKADDGKFLTDTARAMAGAILDASLARNLKTFHSN